MARPSALLTSCLLAANLVMVGWWTWLQVRHAEELQTAAAHLRAGDAHAAALALGANEAEALPDIAASRKRMFLSEGIAFAAVVLGAGIAVLVMLRRQARLDADHDRFLAGATHELKTPLATIQLLLESLRADRLPPDKRDRYLQSGLVEAHRLEAGLTNLLTAAGLRGKVARRPLRAEGDLAADVQRAVASLQARADAAGVRVQVEPLPALPVLRDAEAMQLVLHNLLDNAVKYTPRGGCVRVRIDADGNDAVLSVRDDGQGMDAEALQNAFVPFWRGRDSGTGGTGLGLFLVRELVQSHGGTVAAHSSGAGQGSELTVRLPRRGGAA